MNESERRFRGVWICREIFLETKLSPAEKMLLAEIDSLTGEDHGCYADTAHFAVRLGCTESRAKHVLARLTQEGYIVRIGYNGRVAQRVIAPEYSSNPATSARLIRSVKNSTSEALKTAPQECQKQHQRSAKNSNPLILEKVPTENPNRKTTTTINTHEHQQENDESESTEASSSRRSVCGAGLWPANEPGANQGGEGDVELAAELAAEFGLSRKQQQTVIGYCLSQGDQYVRQKAGIVRSVPRRNAAGALLNALKDDWKPVVAIRGEKNETHIKTVRWPNRNIGNSNEHCDTSQYDSSR